MVESEPMIDQARLELDRLLKAAAERERRSRKRAVWLTVIPIVVGLVFLATSLYKVRKLEQRAIALGIEINYRQKDIQDKSDRLKVLDDQARDAEVRMKKAEAGLTEIEKGVADAKETARQTLQDISLSSATQPIELDWMIVLGTSGDRRSRTDWPDYISQRHDADLNTRFYTFEIHDRKLFALIYVTKQDAEALLDQVQKNLEQPTAYIQPVGQACKNPSRDYYNLHYYRCH